eukprot:TRINITY_DN27715_c0_g3_i3.p1 TRINITY_DN27715_c0_g3~~TRINITY_DN27715_c0_g3_i3.p1  ORF type:complete len:372 (+),score=66.92 TRINITY_DN27715_c0_g3_i3:44-1159(+)
MESLFDGCCRSTGNVDKETAVVEWDAARQDSSVEVTPSQKELVSCICGAVQVFISTEAAKRVLCHCEDCRRWTGSAGVMSAWYPRSEVVTRGELTSFRKHPKSTRLRKNCARCFSCLLVEHADPVVNILEICIGSMKQDLVKLDAHLFFSQPVLRMADQVNKFIDMPQILGGSGKLIREEDVWKDAPDGGSPSVEARCLCSAVRIKITGAPQFVGLCHCIDCRTWTGGVGHLAVVVPMEQAHMFYQQRIMSIKDGVPKLKDRPKELGGSGRRLVQDETPYSISLERPSDRSIGLEFQNEKCEGEAGRIASIEPGSLIDAWNKSGDPKRRVLVDDRLISVNGITASSDEEVRKLCKGIGKLHLMLARHMMVD